jgi:hypothetical protein
MLPLWLLIVSLGAWLPASQPKPMELSFTRVAVVPGQSAALPIYLVADDPYREPFQITLEYRSADLTFEKVVADYLAEKAKWTMGAAARDHPEKSGWRVVQIDIIPGSAAFFPSGLVAHAHFLVNKTRKDGDILLAAALRAPAGAVPVASVLPGKITVQSTPVFGCFFYMH